MRLRRLWTDGGPHSKGKGITSKYTQPHKPACVVGQCRPQLVPQAVVPRPQLQRALKRLDGGTVLPAQVVQYTYGHVQLGLARVPVRGHLEHAHLQGGVRGLQCNRG